MNGLPNADITRLSFDNLVFPSPDLRSVAAAAASDAKVEAPAAESGIGRLFCGTSLGHPWVEALRISEAPRFQRFSAADRGPPGCAATSA